MRKTVGLVFGLLLLGSLGGTVSADTVFPPNVEIQGSLCVGQSAECFNGEPFSEDLKIKDTSPQLSFEQTGGISGPFQIWQLFPDSIGFDITDLTNFTIPFRIESGAPSFSLMVQSDGKVGLGTFAPQGNLHIFGDDNSDIFNGIGPDLVSGPALNFGYSGSSFGRGSGFFNVRPDALASPPNPSLRFATQNVQRMIITNTGRVGIGTLSPTQQLDVTGNIRASGSFIAGGTTLSVPDYVFEPDYQLMPLPELAVYVAKEKHLPDIPTAREVKERGVNISELQMQLLKKIEELTLYTLQQQKTIDRLTARLAALEHHTKSRP
jgi:hypothetical protein